MDADALIADLRDRGVELRAVDGTLEARPRRAVPPHLLEELAAREPEIVRRLVAPAVADAMGGVSPAPQSRLVAEVCAMRLDYFAGAGLVVTVNSEVLGERVIFASDNAVVDPGELRPVYRARELRALLGLRDPGELRRIHELKETFRGTITDWLPSCHKARTSNDAGGPALLLPLGHGIGAALHLAQEELRLAAGFAERCSEKNTSMGSVAAGAAELNTVEGLVTEQRQPFLEAWNEFFRGRSQRPGDGG